VAATTSVAATNSCLLGQAHRVGVRQIAADAVDIAVADPRAVEQAVDRAPGAVALFREQPLELGVDLRVVAHGQAPRQGLARRVVHLHQVGEQAVLGLDPLADIFGQVPRLGVGGAFAHEDEGRRRRDARHGDRQDRHHGQEPPRQWRVTPVAVPGRCIQTPSMARAPGRYPQNLTLEN
jgi:hypothetical protein